MHIVRSIDDIHDIYEMLICRHGAPRPTTTTHRHHTHHHTPPHTTSTSASAPRVLRLDRRTVTTSSQCQPERK